MAHIVLTEEQAKILSGVYGEVAVQDNRGQLVGSMVVFSPEDLKALEIHRRQRQNPQPGIPSAQVRAHLQKLEEISQREDLDEQKVLELLRRMRAGEDV